MSYSSDPSQCPITVAIVNDTRSTNHYGCMLVMKNLCQLLKAQNVEVLWTWPVSVDWRKHQSKILGMPKVDAILVNGEGTIHHNNERKFAAALTEFAHFALSKLQTPSYLINATLHANSAESYAYIKQYQAIYVRDRGSLEELHQHSLSGHYVPDLTFYGQLVDQPEKRSGVCVVDSAVREDNSWLRDFAQRNQLPFKKMIVARPGNAKFLRSPRPYVKNIYHWLTSDFNLSNDPHVYMNYLSQYGLIITGRYHTVTMCIKNRIPFVTLESNTPKIRNLLMSVFGNTDRSISKEAIAQLDLKAQYRFSDNELTSITRFHNQAKADIETMMTDIIAEIRSSAFEY